MQTEHIWKGVSMRNNLMRFVAMAMMLIIGLSVSEGQAREGKLGIGANGAYYMFDSDFTGTEHSAGVSLNIDYSLSDYLSLRGAMGVNQLQAKGTPYPTLLTTYVYGSLALGINMLPNESVNPFVYVGGSAFYFDPRTGGRKALPGVSGGSGIGNTLIGGAGLEIHLSEFIALSVAGEASLPTSDRLDGVIIGSKDMFYGASVGIRYYVFDSNFVKRMLKAYEERAGQ